MKTRICLLLFLCFALLAFAGCQEPTPDPYDEAMALLENGEIEAAYAALKAISDREDAQKALEQFYFLPVGGSLIGNSSSMSMTQEYTITYNEDDLPMQLISDGDLEGRYTITYTYDTNRNLIKEVDEYAYGTSYIYEYTYDSEGRFIKEIATNPEGEQRISEYTYNAAGQVTEWRYISYAGKTTVYTNTYDAEGNLVQEDVLHSDRSKSQSTYTKEGDLILSVRVDAYGSELSRFELTYDGEGRLTRQLERARDGGESIEEYSYDEKGNLIQKVCTSGSDIRIYTYVYNEQGKLLSEAMANQEGVLSTLISYTYDESGLILIGQNDGLFDTTYTYDEKGRLILEEWVSSEGAYRETVEYTYNEQGALIKREETQPIASGGFGSNIEEYDAYGHRIRSLNTNFQDGSTMDEKIEYRLAYLPFALSGPILDLIIPAN